MNRAYRRFLFYLSICIFLFLGYFLVVYALGYKYDFVNAKFVKTGSFQIHSNVSAEIYVNDELAGSTSFLGNTFSQSRLLPRTYIVRVQNSNYQSWQKKVDITAGLLADFPNVILLPQKITENFVASSSFANITNIKFDPDNNVAVVTSNFKSESINLSNGKKIITTPTPTPSVSNSPSPTPSLVPIPTPDIPEIKGNKKSILSPDKTMAVWFTDHEIWLQWLKDSNHQPYQKTGDIKLLTRYSQTIKDIQWYHDSAHLIADIGGILHFIEIDPRGGINAYEISSISSTFFYSPSANAIYKFEGSKLIRINLEP